MDKQKTLPEMNAGYVWTNISPSNMTKNKKMYIFNASLDCLKIKRLSNYDLN